MTPHLPSKDKCCGCAACVDICSKKVIELMEDCNGYYYPSINFKQCVECGLCEDICHINHPERVYRNSCKVSVPYAGWSLDEDIIEKSASGGVFAQLAHDFLAVEGHYVYGASLQKDNKVKHIEIGDRNHLHLIQNSKYQQSDGTGVFSLVRKRLKSGNKVLFSGVPCQVAALYAYLRYKKELLENLITIEVICHGVPTNYISKLALKINNAESIVAYRTKSKGWLNGNRLTYLLKNGRVKECENRCEDFLFRTYLSFSFSFSRQNCYKCEYAKLDRVADLTLGDFWGYQKSNKSEQYENYKGISLILANSDKGKDLLSASSQIKLIETDWSEFLPYNQNLYMPTNRYMYRGCNWVHKLRIFPLNIQKIIYQNGFSNPKLDRWFHIIYNKLVYRIRKRKDIEVEKQCQKAINEIKA